MKHLIFFHGFILSLLIVCSAEAASSYPALPAYLEKAEQATLVCCELLASAEGKRLIPRQRSPKSSSDPWVLRIAEGSNFCYVKPAEVRLRRDNVDKAAKLIIKDNRNGRTVKLRWPAHVKSLAWPVARMPLVGEQAYLIDVNQAITAVTFHQVPTGFSNNAKQEQWMVDHGCSHQVGILQSREESDAAVE